MTASSVKVDSPAVAAATRQPFDLLADLFPLHRSITGDGLRESLRLIGREIPLDVIEVPTGTPVWDWSVPQEWRIREGYIADDTGRRVVDYRDSNLHVVSYSGPVRARLRWSELAPHLHTVPSMPTAIPYRTLFFREGWGFCLTHESYQRLAERPEAEYDVVIDSELFDGSLTLGELLVPGDSAEECLWYAHSCHPSLADDNLSGMVVATWLAKELLARPQRRLTHRFVFAPATIGALTWLALRRESLSKIRHGLVLALLGDGRPFTYKRTAAGDLDIDFAVQHVLENRIPRGTTRPFDPSGYDDRQFNAPGFRLPIGCLMRSPNGEFPEYHTSGDNLSFVNNASLRESVDVCLAIVDALESNVRYRSLVPFGEPQLGRRGLYRAYREPDERGRLQEAILWILNQSDGQLSLLSISMKSKLPLELLERAAAILQEHRLIEPVSRPASLFF